MANLSSDLILTPTAPTRAEPTRAETIRVEPTRAETTRALETQVEFALLDRLHLEEDSPYTWQSLEIHPQLDRLRLDDAAIGWTEAAISAGAGRFFSTLDVLWEQTKVETTVETAIETPIKTAVKTVIKTVAIMSPIDRLYERFGHRVPTDLLTMIADRAAALTNTIECSGQAAIAQLIHCVDGSIPGWSADDWRTIARPYALAMRDQSARSAVSEEVAWDELSTIERAKLSLEVTLAALEELQRDYDGADDEPS